MRDVTKLTASRITLGRLSTALALLSGGGWAGAQTATSNAAGISDTALETIVVTAQRRAEDIQTVPISIQAFTGKQLEELGVKSSSDIAQFTSNVEIALPSGSGNQPLISIRGIGLNDYDTNNAGPNGVYLDEVYLSSPSAQTFATFDLQGVEVLKGPQGTLYGRNTDGGAINLTTVKPSDEFSSNLHAEYGSYNTANLEGAVGGPLTSTLDGRFAFDANHSDGYVHNLLTGDDENGSNNYAARAMLLYKPIDGLDILFNVHAGQVNNRPTEYRHIGDFDPASLASPTGPTQCSVAQTYAGQCVDLFGYGTPAKFYDGAYNRQQHLRVTTAGSYVKVTYNLGSLLLTSISAIDYNDKLHPEDTDASPNRLLEINYGVRSTNYSQEFRVSQNADRYHWVAGLYYLHEKLNQNQPLFALLDGDAIFGAPGALDGIAFRAFDSSEQLTDAYAVFGQGEYRITDQLKLVLGGRVTDEHKTFHYSGSIQPQEGGEDHFGPVIPLATDVPEYLSNGAFSWRAGLNYNFTPDILAYVSAATGFKSGDFNGSFLSTVPAEIDRQLVPVKPEHVKAYEIGIKSMLWDRRLIVDAAAFYNDYRDMQVFVLINDVAGGAGLPLNVLDNAPKAHTQGLDLTVTVKPTTQFSATLQAGILQAKLDQYLSTRDPNLPDYSGNQLPLAPHVSGSVLLEYKVPLGTGILNLQGNANYKSHVFFDTSNDPYIQQGGYWLGNVRAAYDFDKNWEIAAYVHNVANKEYYSDKFDLTSTFGFIQAIMGTPRMAGVEFNWRY
jgi:iron complex outermembrane receptor protein